MRKDYLGVTAKLVVSVEEGVPLEEVVQALFDGEKHPDAEIEVVEHNDEVTDSKSVIVATGV